MGQHRVAEAAELYRRALELKPDYPDAANGLSNALRVLGRWDEALVQARLALELRPDFPDALGHLADSHAQRLRVGRPAGAGRPTGRTHLQPARARRGHRRSTDAEPLDGHRPAHAVEHRRIALSRCPPARCGCRGRVLVRGPPVCRGPGHRGLPLGRFPQSPRGAANPHPPAPARSHDLPRARVRVRAVGRQHGAR